MNKLKQMHRQRKIYNTTRSPKDYHPHGVEQEVKDWREYKRFAASIDHMLQSLQKLLGPYLARGNIKL